MLCWITPSPRCHACSLLITKTLPHKPNPVLSYLCPVIMKGEIPAPRCSQEHQWSNPMSQQRSFLETSQMLHAQNQLGMIDSKLFSKTSVVKLARKQRYLLYFMAKLVTVFCDPMIYHYFFSFLRLSYFYAYSKKLLKTKNKLDFKDLPPKIRSFNIDFSNFKQGKVFLLLFLNANSHYLAGKDPFQVPLPKRKLKKV